MFVCCFADEDEDSDEESSDESDLSESEDESDEEGGNATIHYDLDVCPQGCDQNIYDNTTQLREKRYGVTSLCVYVKGRTELI